MAHKILMEFVNNDCDTILLVEEDYDGLYMVNMTQRKVTSFASQLLTITEIVIEADPDFDILVSDIGAVKELIEEEIYDIDSEEEVNKLRNIMNSFKQIK